MSPALKIGEGRTKMLDVLCRVGGLPNYKCILVLRTRHRLLLKAVTLVRGGGSKPRAVPIVEENFIH